MGARHHVHLVRHRPGPALAGLVAGVVGMSERAPGPVRRRQPAGSLLPLVVSFGDPLRIDAHSDAVEARGTYRSFFAGFSTGHALTRFDGGQDCVQVYLTPLGARRLLSAPGVELARRVVRVDDVAARLGHGLTDRVGEAATWTERFALVEAALVEQAAAQRSGAPPWVEWMWEQIVASGGRAAIGPLVRATGWSQRHATTVFEREIGLTPKQAAGVVRFEAAAADLGRLPAAEVAARHGYYDQSHLSRAVARYAGETPGELAAARRPTALTALGGPVSADDEGRAARR